MRVGEEETVKKVQDHFTRRSFFTSNVGFFFFGQNLPLLRIFSLRKSTGARRIKETNLLDKPEKVRKMVDPVRRVQQTFPADQREIEMGLALGVVA